MKVFKLFLAAFIVLVSSLPGTVSNAAEPPAISSAVAPVYPETARLARITGDVSVDITIDRNGKVSSAVSVNGNTMLRKPAEDAARQWTFVAAPPRDRRERMARLEFAFVIVETPEVTSVFYPWDYKVQVTAPVSR
jgi:TonB family protein